mgnify:CR=1 FL=1
MAFRRLPHFGGSLDSSSDEDDIAEEMTLMGEDLPPPEQPEPNRSLKRKASGPVAIQDFYCEDEDSCGELECPIFTDPTSWPDPLWGERHSAACDDPACECREHETIEVSHAPITIANFIKKKEEELAKTVLICHSKMARDVLDGLPIRDTDLAMLLCMRAPKIFPSPINKIYAEYMGVILGITGDTSEAELLSLKEELRANENILKCYAEHFGGYILRKSV